MARSHNPRGSRPVPFYPLRQVYALLDDPAGEVCYVDRSDGKSNPKALGFTKLQARTILRSLSLSDFQETVERAGYAPADVYFKTLPLPSGRTFQLYIKFQLLDHLLVISFHEREY